MKIPCGGGEGVIRAVLLSILVLGGSSLIEPIDAFSVSALSSASLSSQSHHRVSLTSSTTSTSVLAATSTASTMSDGQDVQSNTNTNNDNNNDDMRFSKFIIPSSSIFYRTKLSAAFVNLRPIVPGHVLVMPSRIVPHLKDLTDNEYDDLWRSVRVIQKILQQHYTETTAFNVAVQDGKAAGQSVPHVHVHILPRKGGDFTRNDQIYEELEDWAPRLCDVQIKRNEKTNSSTPNDYIDVPDDADRKDRTVQQMADEASQYRTILQEQQQHK